MSNPSILPSGSDIFLDHVGLFVPDFDASPDKLRRLGFMLTPFVAHVSAQGDDAEPAPSGTGNQCAMLREGYLEILGATADTPLARQLREQLARYPGVHLVAFAATEAEQQRQRLVDRGFEVQPLVHLQRPVRTPQGEQTARFSVLRLKPGTMPEGRFQFVTHHTPELVWQPIYQGGHRNGAEALTGVLICVDDVAEAAERFGRFTGLSPKTKNELAEIELPRGRLVFVTPRQLNVLRPNTDIPCMPYIAEISLRSRNLEETKHYLVSESVAYDSVADGELQIPPEEALGVGILFHHAGAIPWREAVTA